MSVRDDIISGLLGLAAQIAITTGPGLAADISIFPECKRGASQECEAAIAEACARGAKLKVADKTHSPSWNLEGNKDVSKYNKECLKHFRMD